MNTTTEAFVDDLRDGVGALPRNCESLQFEEPWQGRVFGMALALAEAKSYPWESFRQSLIATIGTWDKSHAPDDETWNYYEQWLSAFETLVLDRGLVTTEEIDRRTEEFRTRSRDEVI
ncbi:nitrile hydratase accessory protein [Azospirillum endophyticum]